MTKESFDLAGIGNACMDLVAQVDDSFLAQHGIKKSHCTYVEPQELETFIALLPDIKSVAGGSAANTIHCVSALGGKLHFSAKSVTMMRAAISRMR